MSESSIPMRREPNSITVVIPKISRLSERNTVIFFASISMPSLNPEFYLHFIIYVITFQKKSLVFFLFYGIMKKRTKEVQ